MLKTEKLDINNFILKEDIGEGNFGKVKLCIYKPTREEYAIKILNKEAIKNKMKNTFFQENEIATKFNHINVIYVFEIFEDNENYYLVMEYCKKGELFDYIVKHQRLTENESAIFFYQLINGIEYIHSKGIAHRDLKPENLLLTNDKILKIIDFGLSHEFNGRDLLKTKCGSPSYAAPEIICCPFYDGFKTDIWCCGIILYAMLCGFLPFEGDDNTILFRNILECDPEMPDWLSISSRELIKKILNPDPDERITLEEIKKHKFYLKGKKLCNINYEEINYIIQMRDLCNKKNNDNNNNINEYNKEKDNSLMYIENKENDNILIEDLIRYNSEQIEKNEKPIFNKKIENNSNSNEDYNYNNYKNYKYNYCNTISGDCLKIKPFNKLYNIKNNNSINSFRKKIMDTNLNRLKKPNTINNKNEIQLNKDQNNALVPSIITNGVNNNILLNKNFENNNFNSINSNTSKNTTNEDKKFLLFLSRINSFKKPLFLKIISSSINTDVKQNKVKSPDGYILNSNNEEENNNNDKKKYISFLKKFKNNFRNLNQKKKLINNYLHTNTISCTNRLNNIKNENKKNYNNNNNELYNNNLRDKLYSKLNKTNANTPIHIKNNNIQLTSELNRNCNKNKNNALKNNSEPKPILYCSNLSININNININQKLNNISNEKIIKNKNLSISSHTTKASSSQKLTLKTEKEKKKEIDKFKSNTIDSNKNRNNDLFIPIKLNENSKNKINLSKIIQKRIKKNTEKKNSINFYTNVKNITDNSEKRKNKAYSSTKRSKNHYTKKSDNSCKPKVSMILKIFNNNYKSINYFDNKNKQYLTMSNNISKSLKKINKK